MRYRRSDHSAAPARVPALTVVLQRSIVLAAALATLLFASPLAMAVNGLYRSQAFSDLAREAERLRTTLTDPSGRSDPGERVATLRIRQPASTELGVYTADGRRVAGAGPATGEAVVRHVGRTGIEEENVAAGSLVVVVPVPDAAGRAPYLVRAARRSSEVRDRTLATWAVMAALAAVVLGVVTALARARARQIARPLQQLAQAADQLGQGDFSVRAVRAGVAEVDAVSINLERTARRLGAILERERAFSSDASHQLRTPLTAVRVGLESALMTPGADVRAAATEALDGLDRLEQTVLDLLALARDTRDAAPVTNAVLLVRAAAGQWDAALREQDRRIDLDLGQTVPLVAVSPQALRTVLDVLLGNALTHGGGTVHLRVEDAGTAVLVEVSDEGPGISADPAVIFLRRSPEARGTGIGLALARSLIEADGGRLELTKVRSATFTVLLPVARAAADPLDERVSRPASERVSRPASGGQRSGAS